MDYTDPVLFRAILAVLVIIYLVPLLVRGFFSTVWDLEPRAETPPSPFFSAKQMKMIFWVGKFLMAAGFVVLFSEFLDVLGEGRGWLLYAGFWWVWFGIGEVVRATRARHSWKEAIVGIISEAIYFPLAAYVTSLFLLG